MRLKKLVFGLVMASIAGSTMAEDAAQGAKTELKQLQKRLEVQENKQPLCMRLGQVIACLRKYWS